MCARRTRSRRRDATLTGSGNSAHQIAAGLGGRIDLSLGTGVMRRALAEISGTDLRGLGLTLARSDSQVPIRCGVGKLEVKAGTVAAEQLVLDTQTVLITGSGVLNLDSETWDMRIEGHPKETRLVRLHAPILVGGTLRRPALSLDPHDAKLHLVDRGTGARLDCGAVH
jgi:uncharacterized protein involved in outer membrane biogenesis